MMEPPPTIRDLAPTADFVERAGKLDSAFGLFQRYAVGAVLVLAGARVAAAGPLVWRPLGALGAAYGVVSFVTTLRDHRASPPWYAGTAEGLVRVLGADTRTIPWSKFRGADGGPRSRSSPHGTVWLYRPFMWRSPVPIRAREGLVWGQAYAMRLEDVPRAKEIADACSRRIRESRTT